MKSQPTGQSNGPENKPASTPLLEMPTAALLEMAKEEQRKFSRGRRSADVARKRLFAISQAVRSRGERKMGRKISLDAWAIEPDNLAAGQPTDWQVLSDPRVHAKIAKIAREKTVVFIMGCARSGTTVTQHFFSTLHSPIFFWKENSLAAIAGDWPGDGETLLLKRRSNCHLYVDLIPEAVKVVWMVRHPYSVITSKHRSKSEDYYVSTERWLAEYAAYKWLRKNHPPENLAVVRYEDLTNAPDVVQERVEAQTGLRFDAPFSKFENRKKIVGGKGTWSPLRPGRALDAAAFADHRERLNAFIAEAGPALDEFAEEFGYEIWK